MDNQADRIFDPLNYKEACYFIARESLSMTQREFIEDLSCDDILQWLGSESGNYFIRVAEDLIDQYPFKGECSSAIVCGNVVNKDLLYNHRNWVLDKLLEVS